MKTSKKNLKKHVEDDKVYCDYPIDIWFLISDWIKPEEVQTFSRICLKTAYICSTARFWLSLYKRYYHPNYDDILPEILKPDCVLSRIGGLKANVIRSLFILHPPLNLRTTVDSEDYDKAKGKTVIGMSHFKEKHFWTYYFKIKSPSGNRRFTSYEKKLSIKEQKINRDVFCNPDEGCQLIELRSLGFVPPPQFNEEAPYVKEVLKLLSAGFRYYKVKLVFSNYSGNLILGEPLIFDPVISIRLINWWEPHYLNILNKKE